MRISRYIVLLIIMIGFSIDIFAQTGSIKGNVSDKISKDGLAGASILISSAGFSKNEKRIADDKGNFQVLGLTAGDYVVTFENIGYENLVMHYSIKAGDNIKIYVGLTIKISSLSEVQVTGYLDREKETGSRAQEKNAGNIVNVISSQVMVRSPDINAANVLQRMSGVTIQRSSGGDEAYAVIRGMEPRYNNTLVNGIKIASPDNKFNQH
ncbi:MAG TPA: TonB-dependent receptor plug domain-containing protein [Chitinophagaceae bacterium]